jgi:hypothetical protein
MDGDQVKSFQDLVRFANRDPGIAPVMEKEVLSKHRQALMLLGMFHLLYGPGRNAVSFMKKAIQTSRWSRATRWRIICCRATDSCDGEEKL